MIRKAGYVTITGLLLVLAVFLLRGPQGAAALREKSRQIRALLVENAELRREVEEKKLRIVKLTHDREIQIMEVYKNSTKVRKGDTKFVLPIKPKPAE